MAHGIALATWNNSHETVPLRRSLQHRASTQCAARALRTWSHIHWRYLGLRNHPHFASLALPQMCSCKKCTSHVGKRNPSAAFVELCAPTGILLSTQKQCWEVTETVTCLPSLSHQKVTLHWHSSVFSQTTGVYSCFKQTPRTQKAQDNLDTPSKEYLNRAPWNLFASIQDR